VVGHGGLHLTFGVNDGRADQAGVGVLLHGDVGVVAVGLVS
jgi:hypothetical protein